MSNTVSEGPLTLRRIELRRDDRQLRLDGEPVKLGARAFDLLVALADRPDRVVSKNELLDLVWPGLVVEENNLQVHISSLRKLLGPAAISTVPGRGYRFTPGAGWATAAAQAAAPAVAATPAAAPQVATGPSLFGRRSDLDALRSWRARHRLISIVGTGGLGKTRLAQTAVQEAASEFADGSWLVELAALTEARQLPGAVARALGMPWSGDGDAAQLAERLASHQALLALDNAEHLVDAVADLAQALLLGAPGLVLLVTSQVPLRLHDEYVMRLSPLAVGKDDGDSDDGDAVALFTARARSVQPWFAPDERQRADIGAICEALDGLPLAIELAAARVPLLGVDGLRQRMDQRFRLLTSGPRDAPARQKTLHAALSWSHGLLSAEERRLFRRLGVFTGSFSLDLALQTLPDPGEDEWTLLDVLGALVDKSLVIAEADAQPRYRLLESGRAFALEQLSRAGESAERSRRLAQALVHALNATADSHENDLSDSGDIDRCLLDIGNLRAALGWAAGADGDSALLVALASASGWLWQPAGLSAEGLGWLDRALAATTPDTPPAQHARLLSEFAIASNQRDAARELAALEQAAALYRQIDHRQGLYRVHIIWAKKLVWRHDLDGATRQADAAEALWDPSWPPTMRKGLLSARTYILEMNGQPEAGQPLMEELVALMRTHGSPGGLDAALTELAESLFVQGKAAEAVTLRREVVRRMADHRVAFAGMNLANLSAALTFLGEVDEALAVARRALPLLRIEGRVDTMLDHFGLLACRRGQHEAAARLLGCADALWPATGFDRELSEQRAHDMLLEALQSELPADTLALWRAEGAHDPVERAIARALA